ncbi:MAG: hypothetical protein Q9188_000867 [Gyalolechia gomerana]
MIRTAVLQSTRCASRVAMRSQIPTSRIVAPYLSIRPPAYIPSKLPQSARWYSAPAGLSRQEVEGRIMDLLKGFDKEFSIEIPDKEADAIHSIDKAVDYILSQPDGAQYMASAGGLTRRRGGGGGASTGDDEDPSRVTSPAPKSAPSHESRAPETSYSGGENGHKIAFDPRDISESEERSKQPKLTLMEEVLLMGLKDKQGYLSFWNDNISYALRGCIVIELAFRGRISMQKDSSRRRFPLADRVIEVVDDTLTGEVLLDEALKMMKTSEKMSVSSWIDLMSGETWNLMKIGYQLKQVRERLAKGLVDKGILRTEKRNFLLFDMATHPVADGGAKDEIRRRVRNLLTNRTVVLPGSQFLPEDAEFRYIRTISMVCAAYAANVLENALASLGHEPRERAFAQVDELLADYSQWPFGKRAGGSQGIGQNLGQVVSEEVNTAKDKELQLEVVAACLSVFTRLDSLL